MKVLIGCEKSGRVRDEFEKLGHIAYSCDLEPSDQPGNHFEMDILEVLKSGESWDLFIAFPPCTHTAVSGARYFKQKRDDGRQQAAIDFFMALTTSRIPKWAIEQPVSIMSRVYRKPDQIIQPWHFGDDASKKTCLWLYNLPPLKDTNRLPGNEKTRRANQTASGQNRLGPSPGRAALRGITYLGIAKAMAEQWGS